MEFECGKCKTKFECDLDNDDFDYYGYITGENKGYISEENNKLRICINCVREENYNKPRKPIIVKKVINEVKYEIMKF